MSRLSNIEKLPSYFTKNQEVDMLDLALIHPVLLYIFAEMNLYCYSKKLPVRITRVVDERIEGVSVSDTHGDGRAIDISVKGWYLDNILEFEDYFNAKYSDKYGAISYSDHLPRLVVYGHPTGTQTGPHIHIQIRREIDVPYRF